MINNSILKLIGAAIISIFLYSVFFNLQISSCKEAGNDIDSLKQNIEIVKKNISNYTSNHIQRIRLENSERFRESEIDYLRPTSERSWLVGHTKNTLVYSVLFIRDPTQADSFQLECEISCGQLLRDCKTLNGNKLLEGN